MIARPRRAQRRAASALGEVVRHVRPDLALFGCPPQPERLRGGPGHGLVPVQPQDLVALAVWLYWPTGLLATKLTFPPLLASLPAKRGFAKSLAMITRTLPANRGQDTSPGKDKNLVRSGRRLPTPMAGAGVGWFTRSDGGGLFGFSLPFR